MNWKVALDYLGKGASWVSQSGVVSGVVAGNQEKKAIESTIAKEVNQNKFMIFAIILAIFVVNLNYITMFQDVILNSSINIIYGIMVFILLCLFFLEEKDVFKTKYIFMKGVLIILMILGLINSLYHIGYAIFNILVSIL